MRKVLPQVPGMANQHGTHRGQRRWKRWPQKPVPQWARYPEASKNGEKTALAMPFHHGTQHFNYYVVKGFETLITMGTLRHVNAKRNCDCAGFET